MDLYFRKKNKTIIIFISGEIDHHTAKELRKKTENIFSEMPVRNLVFDFKQVTFMDSSGIGMLIGRYKELQFMGGRIAIAEANQKIREILLISGLKQILPLFNTLEEAITYAEGRERNAV